MPGPVTYVLAGQDTNGAFQRELAAYGAEANVKIIRSNSKISFEDAVKTIKTPANIILASHGGKDGFFLWSKTEDVDYMDMFRALPRQGIGYVVLNGCFADSFTGTGAKFEIPHGTVVIPSVGRYSSGYADVGRQFAVERKGVEKVIDVYLEILDAIDPKEFSDRQGINPALALPETLVIGGKFTEYVFPQSELRALSLRAKNGTLDQAAFDRAIKRVEARFDNQFSERLVNKSPSDDAYIASIANRILKGEPWDELDDVSACRVGQALALAYMDESGEFASRIAVAKSESEPPRPIAKLYHNPRDKNMRADGYNPPEPFSSVDRVEQAYKYAAEFLEWGCVYEDQVLPLQKDLIKAGYKAVKANGQFDIETYDAIWNLYFKGEYKKINNMDPVHINLTNPNDAQTIIFMDHLKKAQQASPEGKTGGLSEKAMYDLLEVKTTFEKHDIALIDSEAAINLSSGGTAQSRGRC